MGLQPSVLRCARESSPIFAEGLTQPECVFLVADLKGEVAGTQLEWNWDPPRQAHPARTIHPTKASGAAQAPCSQHKPFLPNGHGGKHHAEHPQSDVRKSKAEKKGRL